MALFPAYENDLILLDTKDSEKQIWLQNTSFNLDINIVGPSKPINEVLGHESACNTKHNYKKKKRKIKKDKKSKKQHLYHQVVGDDPFVIDRKRNLEYLSVPKIARPSAPKYLIHYRLVKSRYSHKRKLLRYYDYGILEEEVKNETEVDLKTGKPDVKFQGFKEDQDLSQTTAFYNHSLFENPHDIEMWLKYVKFQDVVYNFEKSYRKGSIAKGSRALAEKKLAILDKALLKNPNCEILLRERLNIAVSIFPSDELQNQTKKLVEKDPQNIILWQGYIESLQCSMSHCNTPAVLKVYAKCLSTLHQLRCNSKIERTSLEENILRMLYQCGLFLKQSGLFEQLWLVLKLYLELNLNPVDTGKFNFSSNFNEKQLEELEDTILNSQLPIHELWLRIEKLRESCHWLPSSVENCDDPQSIVFAEDVVELIHPITMPGNTIKLISAILTLVKVPLLPSRHSTMQELGLDYVPWAVDSVELLLPLFYSMHSICLENNYLLKDTNKLTVGPQYLKTLPAQEEYLEFVLKIFQNCISCLKGPEKIAVSLWWLRFQRLLVILDKNKKMKITQNIKKRIRNTIKKFLKEEENRNNMFYYQEFALFEAEYTSKENALSILLTSISLNNNNGSPIDSIKDNESQKGLCSLYRSLIELILTGDEQSEDLNNKALKYLVTMALGNKTVNIDALMQGSLNDTALKFKHICLELLQNLAKQKLNMVDHFLPNVFSDWVICYGWFLYLTKGIIDCGVFIEEMLTSLEEVTNNKNSWFMEVLFEFYAAVFLRHFLLNAGSINFKIIEDILNRSIERFPNNLFLLGLLAKVHSLNCCFEQPLFKISKVLLGTGRAIPSAFIILIAQQKGSQMEEQYSDTLTEDMYKNKMLSIFKRLTSSAMCTRRCGLVWRLYLQFLYSHFPPDLMRKAYYAAVEEIPWLKALYMDAAIYIPAELAQIQDLLIEKQLRIHVTPEELDVLRT